MKAIFSVKLDRIWFWLWPRRVPTWPTSESHMSTSQPSPNSDSSASEPGLSAPLESIHPDSEILPKLFFIAFCLEGNVTVDVMRSAGTERDTDGWLCPSHLSSSSVSSSLTADFTCRRPACFNLYLQFGFDVFVLVDARVSIQLSRGVSLSIFSLSWYVLPSQWSYFWEDCECGGLFPLVLLALQGKSLLRVCCVWETSCDSTSFLCYYYIFKKNVITNTRWKSSALTWLTILTSDDGQLHHVFLCFWLSCFMSSHLCVVSLTEH